MLSTHCFSAARTKPGGTGSPSSAVRCSLASGRARAAIRVGPQQLPPPLQGLLPNGVRHRTAVLSAATDTAEAVEPKQVPEPGDEAAASTKSGAPRPRHAKAQEILKRIQVHDLVEGRVVSLQPYGAFVDIGGRNALLPTGLVSHERLEAGQPGVAVGGRVRALVCKVERKTGRITITTRPLETEPGEMLRDPRAVYEKAGQTAEAWKRRGAQLAGQLVEGLVTYVSDKGVIVDIPADSQGPLGLGAFLPAGLVSQQPPGEGQLERIFRKGDRVLAVGLGVRPQTGQLALSTRMLETKPGDMLRNPQAVYDKAEEVLQGEQARAEVEAAVKQHREMHPPLLKVGDLVEGVVDEVRPREVSVRLPGNRHGTLSKRQVSQIPQEVPQDLASIFPVGSRIKSVVISCGDKGAQLATKQLEPVPGDMLRDPQAVYDKAVQTVEAACAANVQGARPAPELKEGDVVEGVVVGVWSPIVYVQLPGNRIGQLPARLVSDASPEPSPGLESIFPLGARITAQVHLARAGAVTLATKAP